MSTEGRMNLPVLVVNGIVAEFGLFRISDDYPEKTVSRGTVDYLNTHSPIFQRIRSNSKGICRTKWVQKQ